MHEDRKYVETDNMKEKLIHTRPIIRNNNFINDWPIRRCALKGIVSRYKR